MIVHPPKKQALDKALKSLANEDALQVRINGSCMMPLIADGAMIQIRNQRKYLPGDILVKRVHNGQLVAHRLLGIYPRRGTLYFITRADNAAREDGAVTEGQIIGRVTGGECMPEAIHITLTTRLQAVGHFFLLISRRLGQRIFTPHK